MLHARHKLYFIPLIVFILLCVFFWRGLSLDPHKLPTIKLNQTLPEFHVPSITALALDSTKEFRGQMSLLNVWGTWCDTCAEEHAFLLKLAHQGIRIYGLNEKDAKSNVLNWLKDLGNPYYMVGLDTKGIVAIDLGVYGTPETFLIDAHGIIRYRHVGPLTSAVWKEIMTYEKRRSLRWI